MSAVSSDARSSVAETANLSFAFEQKLDAFERGLFCQMVVRADYVPTYRAELLRWLKRGNTLLLRDLVQPFGNYWRNLDFANVVDGLDGARAHFKPQAVSGDPA